MYSLYWVHVLLMTCSSSYIVCTARVMGACVRLVQVIICTALCDGYLYALYRYDNDVAMTADASREELEVCDSGGESDPQLLLRLFSDFKSAFESCVHESGEDSATLHLLPGTDQLLQSHLHQLNSALSCPCLPPYSPPTAIASSSSFATARTRSLSSTSELLHLRREVESLRQVQRDCEGLSAQVKESQVQYDR